jgi:hypothetical protein
MISILNLTFSVSYDNGSYQKTEGLLLSASDSWTAKTTKTFVDLDWLALLNTLNIVDPLLCLSFRHLGLTFSERLRQTNENSFKFKNNSNLFND